MISLVVGLGNIGRRYHGTRHNVGFDVLDRVAVNLKAPISVPTHYDRRTELRHNDRTIVLAWPTTYMNLSGLAVAALLQDYSLSPADMLVVVDDFALPLGRLRFRPGGSDGGHNGLASIIEIIGTTDFPRLRLGIGPAPEGIDPADFVLDPFAKSESETASAMILTAAEAVAYTIDHRFDEAMSTFNANPAR